MSRSQVLIIGGGPAGSSAAYFLAKQGIKVTLLDKDRWPRDKVCGGGLTTNCLPVLEKMDVIEQVEQKADFKYDGYIIHSAEGEQIKAPVRRRAENGPSKQIPYCYVIKRDSFDEILLNKAKKAGANVQTGVEAKRVEEGEPSKVITKDGRAFEADILIVADGSGGPITRHFTKDLHKGSAIAVRGYYSGVKDVGSVIEFFLDDELGFGYGWLFPLGDGRINTGIGLDAAFLKRRKKNVRQVFEEMLEKPQLKERMADAKLEGKLEAFPLRMGFDKGAFRHNRVLFVGDSAKLIYPLSGEGIAYALQSGEIAANTITEVYQTELPDYKKLARYEIECRESFSDFKYATRLQMLMSRPKVQRFFYKNSLYDYDLSQRAIGILEHSSDVSTFFNLRTILKSFVIATKRKLSPNGNQGRGKRVEGSETSENNKAQNEKLEGRT